MELDHGKNTKISLIKNAMVLPKLTFNRPDVEMLSSKTTSELYNAFYDAPGGHIN
jgi:1,4-dihydroxy-2-naphthoyl-CoA synthase